MNRDGMDDTQTPGLVSTQPCGHRVVMFGANDHNVVLTYGESDQTTPLG